MKETTACEPDELLLPMTFQTVEGLEWFAVYL